MLTAGLSCFMMPRYSRQHTGKISTSYLQYFSKGINERNRNARYIRAFRFLSNRGSSLAPLLSPQDKTPVLSHFFVPPSTFPPRGYSIPHHYGSIWRWD